MATNWQATRNGIINAALRKVSSNDSGDSIPGHEVDDAAFQMNAIIKEWMGRGIDLWLRREITLFLVSGTQKYSLGTANATESYVETDIRVSAVAADTVVDVDSTTGFVLGDNIGVKLDDGTIHWTTIAAIPDTDTVTLTAAVPSAAAIDNSVYVYTTKSGRPQKILYAYRRDGTNDTPVGIISREEYSTLSNKGSSGPVNQIHHDPQLTTGNLFVWPAVDTSVDKLILIAQDIVSNLDTAAGNPEFPPEWHNALLWNLAEEMAPEYEYEKRNPKGMKFLSYKAKDKLETLLDYDVGESDMRMGMSDRKWG